MKVSEHVTESNWKNNTANANMLYWLDCWENEHRMHLSAHTDSTKEPSRTPNLLTTTTLSEVKQPINISG